MGRDRPRHGRRGIGRSSRARPGPVPVDVSPPPLPRPHPGRDRRRRHRGGLAARRARARSRRARGPAAGGGGGALAGGCDGISGHDRRDPAARAVGRRAAGSFRFIGRALRRLRRAAPRPAIVVCLHLRLSPVARLVAARAARGSASSCTGSRRGGRSAGWSAGRSGARIVLVANSEHTARRFRAANPALARRPISVCHLGVGAAGAPRSGAGGARGVAGPFALIVGRLAGSERYKGHDLLIDLWPRIRAEVPDAHLVVAGDGDDRARLEAPGGRARQLGCGSSGACRTRRSRDLYRESAFFVMPSREEGFGLVFLEAMRAGQGVHRRRGRGRRGHRGRRDRPRRRRRRARAGRKGGRAALPRARARARAWGGRGPSASRGSSPRPTFAAASAPSWGSARRDRGARHQRLPRRRRRRARRRRAARGGRRRGAIRAGQALGGVSARVDPELPRHGGHDARRRGPLRDRPEPAVEPVAQGALRPRPSAEPRASSRTARGAPAACRTWPRPSRTPSASTARASTSACTGSSTIRRISPAPFSSRPSRRRPSAPSTASATSSAPRGPSAAGHRSTGSIASTSPTRSASSTSRSPSTWGSRPTATSTR